MKTPILLAVAAAFVLGSGCVHHERHVHHSAVVEQCRPDEYWDGSHCRHKGHGWKSHDPN